MQGPQVFIDWGVLRIVGLRWEASLIGRIMSLGCIDGGFRSSWERVRARNELALYVLYLIRSYY